jgi:DNA polymerase-4
MFQLGGRGTMRDGKLYSEDKFRLERAILHVDMDAFFAQVEQLHRPELRGKPLLVGLSASRRGVVATCSYEARAFGVRSGMPMGKALELCPTATVVAGSMGAYSHYAEKIREIFCEFSPYVEVISIDEAYLDITDSLRIHPDPVEVAVDLKREVRNRLHLICSIGVSSNKHLAKVASPLDKPDGLTTMWPHELEDKFFPLDVSKLYGVGPVTTARLNALGIVRIGQLARMSVDQLKREFGSNGEHFKRIANGLDDSPVLTHIDKPDPKSISHEKTFESDSEDFRLLDSVILHLTDKVVSRMKKRRFVAGTITLRVRFADFETITRARSVSMPTDDVERIYEVARSLLPRQLAVKKKIRLLGVRVNNLSKSRPADQPSLFSDKDMNRKRVTGDAVEQIRQKYGKYSIVRAGSLTYLQKKSELPE